MNRRDALQKELDHLQEGVGRLFWECELPSDLSLHKARGTVYKLIIIFITGSFGIILSTNKLHEVI